MNKRPEGLRIDGRDRAADLRKLTLKWIEELVWYEAEYGFWGSHGKRPFGNSGYEQIARDILEIVGIDINAALPRCPHCNEVIDEEKTKRLYAYAHDLFADIPGGLLLLAGR